MSQKHFKINKNSLYGYDASGNKRFSFAEGQFKAESASVNMSAEPGRIVFGNFAINSLGTVLPSTLVTPVPAFLPQFAGSSLPITIIAGIAMFLMSLQEETNNKKGSSIKPIITRRYQIVDMNALLPED